MALDANTSTVRFTTEINEIPYQSDCVYGFKQSQEEECRRKLKDRLLSRAARARGREARVDVAVRKAARLRRDVVEYMTENDAGHARAMHDNNIGPAPRVRDRGDGRMLRGDRAAGLLGALQVGVVPPPDGPPPDLPHDHLHDQHVDQHVEAPPLPPLAALSDVQEPRIDVSALAGSSSVDGESGIMGKWKFCAAARVANICMPACLHALFTRRCARGAPSQQKIANTESRIDPERSVNVHTGEGAAAPPTKGDPARDCGAACSLWRAFGRALRHSAASCIFSRRPSS
eukprot:TRINITY_DN5466_c0_g1_i1.p1 TRINITY_DN5466_c0_g1~~TRINITY_DN5466_c0_g1_i1.p1  ORF type:complete len:308 (-),score=46.07 TRINITY_DN5466_c0_g1_i1:532-1395(-)